ncbi:MAG: alanine--tRNA ligase [Bacteroidetes bacterium]|jgi:alanyl-tRNA synthetase|nr:alanine--tRNA ligase [Bacteroidota bacterium]
MRSAEIRKKFLNFFASKNHQIVESAPMVVKDDPTLMFTNAGMNQFKDMFLGNQSATYPRIANTQKCLRVSGKHNDLEEVGHDTYHHTMFEMLGNWSFGDYFKKEAIEWAWEFLTGTLGIKKENLYVTIFEGDKQDDTPQDHEALEYWKQFIPENRILTGSKKDNFWEMGDTGPCGPCSEIHIDIRPEKDKQQTPGHELVNQDHPLVIEIWNLVFIQYNRKANGKLEMLPHKHIDTGMGFERLCMVLQDKTSNYDTDLFQAIIQKIAELSGIPYGQSNDTDIAMRVIADHLRAVSFAITDGQLPSNNKAGYVIRRILRRAIRYSYTFLKQKEPFIHKLLPTLTDVMGAAFPELSKQHELVAKVILEEESSFLKTLSTGIKMLDQVIEKTKVNKNSQIPGKDAFVLYDTYGFPLDLTQLIVNEHGFEVNITEFNQEMNTQKERSKSAASQDTEDWQRVHDGEEGKFIGYDYTEAEIRITRYRRIKTKKKELYQLVFDQSPFYAESGGQIGDTGTITNGEETLKILDTFKENNLIVHVTEKIPANIGATFNARIDENRRFNIMNNHSGTHLLHHALRQVLGGHVEQKGSLVHPDYLRFDFSHFQKMNDEEIERVEQIVNQLIRKNSSKNERREVPIEDAKKLGAMMLFGEKYGDTVRVIQFGDSVELCGGTHVEATGQLGFFKIVSESAIAAGIRRIEAVTGEKAEAYIHEQAQTIEQLRHILKAPQDVVKTVESIVEENSKLQKQIEAFNREKSRLLKKELLDKKESLNDITFISQKIKADSPAMIKDIAFQLKGELDNLFMVLGADINGKPNLTIMIADKLVKEKNLHAGNLVRSAARHIQGGGGGQPFFATAGGKDINGLDKAIQEIEEHIKSVI